MLGVKLVIVKVVGFPTETPIEDPATPNALVEIDKVVPLGLVLGLMLIVMDVENTWKLVTVGATAKVLVEAAIVTVCVDALVLSFLDPLWNP